jgi:hypothetical protein
MRVKIRGVTFETVREAAKAHNVTRSYVYDAIERGRADIIGIGIGNREPNGKFVKNQVTLYGVTFPSMKAASLALGLNKHYVRGALTTGSPVSNDRLKMAVFKYANQMEGDANAG